VTFAGTFASPRGCPGRFPRGLLLSVVSEWHCSFFSLFIFGARDLGGDLLLILFLLLVFRRIRHGARGPDRNVDIFASYFEFVGELFPWIRGKDIRPEDVRGTCASPNFGLNHGIATSSLSSHWFLRCLVLLRFRGGWKIAPGRSLEGCMLWKNQDAAVAFSAVWCGHGVDRLRAETRWILLYSVRQSTYIQ